MFLNNMIKIIGNSNYKTSVIKKDKLYILKESFTNNDSERLKKQIIKQETIQGSNYNIKTPKIITKEKSRYMMEYVKSYDMINYMNIIDIHSLKSMMNNIIKLVNTFIKDSQMIVIDRLIVTNKIDSIKLNLQRFHKNSIVIHSLDYLRENISILENTIPVGICHGDLTLSNMLIDYNHELYLIDFLDDFINTPIFDIIKLRQDIKYKYVLEIYKGTYDKIKIEQIFKYFDKLITNEYAKYELYFKYFDIMNFLRILQYSKNSNLDNYLLKTIHNILQK
jgi:thiamine kinase-like enzyme